MKPLEELSFDEAWENLINSEDYKNLHAEKGFDHWDSEKVKQWVHEFYVLGTLAPKKARM